MTLYPSPVIASELARTVLVENYFYRVRMEAARALVAVGYFLTDSSNPQYNTAEADYMGLFLLMKIFQTFYCHPTDDGDPVNAEAHPLPNDFSNLSDYFMKKSIITALAELRDPATRLVWRPVRRMLLNVLRGNDNADNTHSDSYYIATVISAVGSAFAAGVNMSTVSISEQEREIDNQLYKEASEANERALTVDRLVPSYHNVVTEAGLQAQLKSIMVGQRTNDPRIFLGYTREGNYEPLRLLAFDALLLCKPPGRSLSLAQYLFDVIKNDYSLTVRRHVSRAISESILMTLAVGEVYMNINPGVIEINPDITPEQREKERESEQAKIVKAVRKEFNSKPELRQIVLDALLHAFTGNDSEILFALIKAAEVMSTSTAEPRPGVVITLNTPVAETPSSATPKIRFSLASAGSVGAGEVKPEQTEFPFPKGAVGTVAPGSDAGTPVTTPAAPIKLVLNSNAGSNANANSNSNSNAAAASPVKESKKKKKQPKAQARGLPDQDFKAITIVLGKLTSDKRSIFFRQPVDPTRDNAPDYLLIVTHPMDLSTIRAKVDGGLYSARAEFEADVRLLVANCYLYNPVGSAVRRAGEAFEKYFNSGELSGVLA
jgi:transcription initiation factor TFIID subunit 2